MDLKNFDTIFFDLGNVLLDIDLKRTIIEFGKFTNLSPRKLIITKDVVSWNELLETGNISVEYFRNNFRQKFSLKISDTDFDKCWNALLISIPQRRIEILKKLYKTHQIFLVSNTNEIHAKHYENQPDWVGEYLHKIYYSHITGLRKPDIRFFEKIIAENSLNPKRTIFFDDLIDNIQAAESIGIKGVLMKNQNLEDIF